MEGPLHIVISKEFIKPSSETPHHLRKLQLSYLDQLYTPGYVPIVFFYDSITDQSHQISLKLKKSLSITLTSFYPLAGRIQDKSFIDCNDAGVEFIEARVHAQLTDVSLDNMMEYFPAEATAGSLVGAPLVVVKITFFDCGGIAIGVCISHKIADLCSIMTFVNAWAAECRGDLHDEFSRFSFDLASFFPAREFPDESDMWRLFMAKGKLVMKRLIFDKEKLEALKKAVTSAPGSTVKDPTKVEVVSAFMWKCLMEVSKLSNNSDGVNKDFSAIHAVTLRGRTNPPQLLEKVFGNCLLSAVAYAEYEEELHELVRKLRNSFRKVNEDYITKAQSGDNYLNDVYYYVTRVAKGEVEPFTFSSWRGFGVYEVNFRWGKPVWFFTSASLIKNTTILLDSKSGDGIEALVTIPQENVDSFETQINLLSTNTMNVKNRS